MSPGRVMQSTPTAMLTVSGSRKRIGGRTAGPGYYACAKGHRWRLIAPHEPSASNEIFQAQISGSYVGFSLDGGDSHYTYGKYVKTVAIASGKTVTFRDSDLPPGTSPDPNATTLVFGPVVQSANGTTYCIGQFISGVNAIDGALLVIRLNLDGTHTILDQGNIDPSSLALADAFGDDPGHVYWTKDGIVQSAAVAGAPR